MTTEIYKQVYLFLIFILNGSIIGVLFDFFRILRRSFKTSDIITSIQDILFCTITGFLLIYSIFIFNNGEIRLYVIVGLLIGLILYMLILSKHIIKINLYLINCFKKIICKIIFIILIPFRIIKSIVKRPCKFIFINIKKICKNISYNMQKIVKNKEKIRKKQKNINI